MPSELCCLGWAVALGVAQLLVAATMSGTQVGLKWAAGSRDEPKPVLTGVAGRLDRAFRNYMETFPFFAAALLLAQAMDHHNGWTWWGAQLFLFGRVVYVPLYAAGIYLVRSIAWGAATAGIVAILIGLVIH